MKRGTPEKQNQPSNSFILEALSSDSFLMVNKKLLSAFGPNNAIFISNLLDQLKFFVKKGIIDSYDSWFYLTHSQQLSQTNIRNESTLRRCKKEFKELGVLKTKMQGQPAKEVYRIDIALLWNIINPALMKSIGLDLTKSTGLYIGNKENNKEKIYKKEKEYLPIDFAELLPQGWLENKIFQTAVETFFAHRKALGKPLTARAGKIIINKFILHKSSIEEVVAALNQCVEYNWIGVFPSEGKPNRSVTTRHRQQLLNWYISTCQKPSDAKLKRLRDSDKLYKNRQAERWSMIPSPKKLVTEYEAWLKEQSWIDVPGPALFKPTNTIFQGFLRKYQKDLGIDLITGKNI